MLWLYDVVTLYVNYNYTNARQLLLFGVNGLISLIKNGFIKLCLIKHVLMVLTGYKTVKYQVICTSFISVQNYRVTFASLVVKPVFISRHLCSICTALWTIRLSLHFMQTQPCPLLRTDFKFSSETSPSENIGRRVYWMASTRPFSLLRYQLLVLLHCP